MSEHILDLLKTLSATPGPVGREDLVQEIMKRELGNYCEHVDIDKIGNLIGHKKRSFVRASIDCSVDLFKFPCVFVKRYPRNFR